MSQVFHGKSWGLVQESLLFLMKKGGAGGGTPLPLLTMRMQTKHLFSLLQPDNNSPNSITPGPQDLLASAGLGSGTSSVLPGPGTS